MLKSPKDYITEARIEILESSKKVSKSKVNQLKRLLSDLKRGDSVMIWIADNNRKITKEKATVVQDGPFSIDSMIKIEVPVSTGSNVKDQLSIPAYDIIKKV